MVFLVLYLMLSRAEIVDHDAVKVAILLERVKSEVLETIKVELVGTLAVRTLISQVKR